MLGSLPPQRPPLNAPGISLLHGHPTPPTSINTALPPKPIYQPNTLSSSAPFSSHNPAYPLSLPPKPTFAMPASHPHPYVPPCSTPPSSTWPHPYPMFPLTNLAPHPSVSAIGRLASHLQRGLHGSLPTQQTYNSAGPNASLIRFAGAESLSPAHAILPTLQSINNAPWPSHPNLINTSTVVHCHHGVEAHTQSLDQTTINQAG